jgi:hypothetical protein
MTSTTMTTTRRGTLTCAHIAAVTRHAPSTAKMKKTTKSSEPMFHSDGSDDTSVLNSTRSRRAL